MEFGVRIIVVGHTRSRQAALRRDKRDHAVSKRDPGGAGALVSNLWPIAIFTLVVAAIVIWYYRETRD
jgi:hypothetical protein